jgi:tetratricopeptide (TPR) repeat protein
VISRNSMTGYKGTQKTPQVIAKELGIHYLLSGTVRWQKGAGNASRIRVAPELAEITAAGVSEVRWQDSFDAVVEDVFTVQGEIASRVAGALQVKLGAQEQRQLAARPTTNLAAYDTFLRGEAIWHEGGSDPKTLRTAIEQYELAVKLDPSFALAWARLSFVRSNLFYNGGPDAEIARSARAAGERSLQLSPGLAAGRLAMSWYFSSVEADSKRALEECSEALAVDRNNVDLLMGAAFAEMGLGRWNDALAHADEARSLDPRSVPAIYRNGVILLWLRRYGEALPVFEQALALAPANVAAVEMKAMTLLGEGKLSAAQALLKRPEIPRTQLLVNFGMYWDLYWLFDEEQREALLKLSHEDFGGARTARAITFAQVCAGAGRTAELRKFSEEAERAFAADLATTPKDAQTHVMRGLALAYLGRKDEAVREGERGVALLPVSRDGYSGPYIQHQLVRIYIIVGEKEKALDLLEPLLKIPYYLSPAWLSIDPNFAPLKGHARFEALLHKNTQTAGISPVLSSCICQNPWGGASKAKIISK